MPRIEYFFYDSAQGCMMFSESGFEAPDILTHTGEDPLTCTECGRLILPQDRYCAGVICLECSEDEKTRQYPICEQDV